MLPRLSQQEEVGFLSEAADIIAAGPLATLSATLLGSTSAEESTFKAAFEAATGEARRLLGFIKDEFGDFEAEEEAEGAAAGAAGEASTPAAASENGGDDAPRADV